MFTYWVGERPMVAFADYELINETIVRDGDNYTDRDFFQEFYLLVRGSNLIPVKNVAFIFFPSQFQAQMGLCTWSVGGMVVR